MHAFGPDLRLRSIPPRLPTVSLCYWYMVSCDTGRTRNVLWNISWKENKHQYLSPAMTVPPGFCPNMIAKFVSHVGFSYELVWGIPDRLIIVVMAWFPRTLPWPCVNSDRFRLSFYYGHQKKGFGWKGGIQTVSQWLYDYTVSLTGPNQQRKLLMHLTQQSWRLVSLRC